MHPPGALFRRHLWIWPSIFAAILVGIGWWVYASVEEVLCQQVAASLDTIQDAGVTALRIWMNQQQADAKVLASSDAIVPSVQELLALEGRPMNSESAVLKSKSLSALRSYLGPRLEFFSYTDYFVVSPLSRVLASNQDSAVGRPLDGYRQEFLQRVLHGKPSVSKPFRSPLPMADEKGRTQGRATDDVRCGPDRR